MKPHLVRNGERLDPENYLNLDVSLYCVRPTDDSRYCSLEVAVCNGHFFMVF